MNELKTKLAKISNPLQTSSDLDPLLNIICNSKIILLGEASHGTSEYYLWRTLITKRLIIEKNVSFIAVEGDWPECYLVNRFIKGYEYYSGKTTDVLKAIFKSWPSWMWANSEFANLIDWIKRYNQNLADEKKVGFYGLDVYSLWQSLTLIINYLEHKDRNLVKVAKKALKCFEPYGEDVEKYALETALVPESCETEIVDLLTELKRKTPLYQDKKETLFNIEQNALVALNAERYYRNLVLGGAKSWNIRDQSMDMTLERLMTFHGPQAKAVVWAHNSHVGDASATDMVKDGMINLGQLVRTHEKQEGVVIVGFGSFEGSVLASDAWGEPAKKMLMPPAMIGSWEDILNKIFKKDTLIIFDKNLIKLKKMPGHRAIGVVYNPLNERENYLATDLPRRYDAFIFLPRTNYLHSI